MAKREWYNTIKNYKSRNRTDSNMHVRRLLSRLLYNNTATAVTLSLALISISFLLNFQYKRGEIILQNQWSPIADLKKSKPHGISIYGNHTPIINNRPVSFNRYNIKISLLNIDDMLEIEFCNNYSWILNRHNISPALTGFYHRIDKNRKEYVSEVNYRDLLFSSKIQDESRAPILKKIDILLACDLIEKTANIYINNNFYEKILLDGKQINYFVSLNSTSNITTLKKIQIYSKNGDILFSGNYAFLFFYKTISQILFSLGLAVFCAFLFLERRIVIKFVYLISILFLFEIFLRTTEADNPNFNIRKMEARWDFEKTTNLFGKYNNPASIEISDGDRAPKIYSTAKPANTIRIICLGSSPLIGVGIQNKINNIFPDILEKKINSEGKKQCRVINRYLANSTINSVEQNIYLRDALLKLNPDIIIIYGILGDTKLEKADEILYKKARKLLEEHPDWIRNSRLLYMALEFKNPIKEVVYLYNFLYKSYLFMGIENIRKRVFNKLFYADEELSGEISEFSFKKTLSLCKERNLKIFLIPQFDFVNFESDPNTKIKMGEIIKENKGIYYLDLQDAFAMNRNFLLAYDRSHPSEYGHMVIAEEIYRRLIKEGLIDIDKLRSLSHAMNSGE